MTSPSTIKRELFSKLVLLCFSLMVVPSVWAQFTFEQKSEPAGIFATATQTYESNASVNSRAISLISGTYAFTHWELNGVRIEETNGSALTNFSFLINSNSVAVAHYLDINHDSDNDHVPDWFEVRHLGSLENNQSYDFDGDGISLLQEYRFDLTPTIADQPRPGGISRRRSQTTFVNLGGARKLTLSSDPPGLVISQLTYPEVNSTFTSASLSGANSGFYFSHWEINGVRAADDVGIGLSQVTELMDTDKQIVAKYFDQNLDEDADGIPDWYEWHTFGTLENGNLSDNDNDSIPLSTERKFGLNGAIKDMLQPGGISRRRSSIIPVNLGGATRVRQYSTPSGLIPTVTLFLENNSTYSTNTLSGLSHGYYFSHWEINGQRVADASGLGLGTVSTVLNESKEIVAKFFEQYEDQDADNIPDWFEWQQFGNLSFSEQSDPDEDGISVALERKFGLSSVIADNFSAGGVSRRRSGETGFIFDPNGVSDSDGDGLSNDLESTIGSDPDLVDTDGDGYNDFVEYEAGTDPTSATSMPNQPPTNLLASSDLFLHENQPVGTIVGEFNASDPDGDTLSYSLVSGSGDENNSLFVMEINGTLRSQVVFDYETNASSYSIRVRARDFHQQAIEGNFTIYLVDVDDTPPLITLYGESNLTHEAGTVYLDANASWSDAVDGTGVIVASGEVNASDPGTYTLSYNYTDSAGNAAQTVTRTVVVVDTIAPVISLNGDANITHEAGTVYLDANASWSDAVDGTGVIVASGEVNASDLGTYVLSYNYTDVAGNVAQTVTRTIIVVDTTAPVISLHGDSNITHEAGTVYLDANASWSDAVDGLGVIIASGEVNASKPGTYELSYNYTDAAGNVAQTVTRTVHVVDTTAPVISLYGDSNITHEAGNPYIDLNASWSDVVDGTGVILASGEVNTSEPGVYLLSYNYTDAAGNAAQEVTREVEVINLAPEDLFVLDDRNLSILENEPNGTVVGVFQGIDPNPNHVLTYSLVSKEEPYHSSEHNGTEDNASLSIPPEFFLLDPNGTLTSLYPLDYEVDPKEIPLLVRVADQHGAFFERSFSVSVLNVVEDFDEDGVEDHFDPDDDNDGFDDSLEQTFGFNPFDRWDYPKAPIVRTREVSEQNGTLIFGAEILSSGGFANLDVFVSILDESGELITELVQTWSEGNEMDVSFTYEFALQPGQEIHYQAFAQNYIGKTEGQQLDYWIGGDPALGKWWGNDTDLVGGWRESSWFGFYLPNLENEWVYHLQLGWLYVQLDGEDGFWLWMPEEKWLWTKKSVWPFLWSDSSSDWLYPIYSSGVRYFYDYAQGKLK